MRETIIDSNHFHPIANSSEPISGISFSLFGGNRMLGQVTQTSDSAKTNSLSLKYILKNIVEWILISCVSSQKLKVNLYGALLNFMQIIKLKQRKSEPEVCGEKWVRLYIDGVNFKRQLPIPTKMIMWMIVQRVFASVGDKIIDLLCHDCTTGHDVCWPYRASAFCWKWTDGQLHSVHFPTRLSRSFGGQFDENGQSIVSYTGNNVRQYESAVSIRIKSGDTRSCGRCWY